MNQLRHIRTLVFGCSQAAFAAVAGVRQATVSRWETGQLSPSLIELERIRDEAIRRELAWSDAFFFDDDPTSAPNAGTSRNEEAA